MTARPPDDDLIDTGTPRSSAAPWRPVIRVGAVVLVAGAAIAFALARRGGGDRGEQSLPPSPSASATPGRLELDGASGCGTLVGGVLSVAFAVRNTGGQSLVLADVRPVLPLGGLRSLGGAVDRPPSGGGCPDAVLGPGETMPANSGGWIALEFRATTSCLTPLPVEVDVDVDVGRRDTTRLSPFPDLGAVPAAGRGC